MLLTEFIEQNHKKIIEEWVIFAGTLLPWAKGMSERGLRDHAEELLNAVVADMEAPQSRTEQSEKSKGQAAQSQLGTVGHKHASERLKTGFKLDQLVSEYRALRASVLRLWAEQQVDKQTQMTRFNEAIDESLTEALLQYSRELHQTREQFLGILGHDLRNPLAAILMAATSLEKSSVDDKQLKSATRILSSAGRMSRMVSDLLDLTRTRLGGGIPVTAKPMDLKLVCEEVIAELEAVHVGCDVRFESTGDVRGEWDSDRLVQVVSNLVANALQHGGADGRVRVAARGHDEEVVLQVQNGGPTIPQDALKRIFDPMVRQPVEAGEANTSGLGLGLFIASEVVIAHGGTIGATSTKTDGTTFTVKLPRHPPAPPDAESEADRSPIGDEPHVSA